MNNQFLRPMATCFINRSVKLLSIGSSAFDTYTCSAVQWLLIAGLQTQ